MVHQFFSLIVGPFYMVSFGSFLAVFYVSRFFLESPSIDF